MKSNREKDSTCLRSGSDWNQSSQATRNTLTDIVDFLKDRQELAVVVALGTSVILSILFLLACLRAMIPVEGVLNWNDVRVGNDFIVFYSSGLLALGGEAASAYDQTILNAFQHDVLGIDPESLPWRYPPIYFFFLLPFTSLGYLGAFWTWSVFTITALMIVVRQITPIWYFPILVPLCLPVAYTMTAGQNGNLTAILIGAGLLMLPRSGKVAGILFGLLAYKPQLAVVVPFCLLAGRYYCAFISMAVTVVSLALLSWLVFGLDPWVAFFQGLLFQTSSAFGSTQVIWERIPTVVITALQIFESSRLAWILQTCVALLALTLAAWVWKTSVKPAHHALALVASIPLVSPYVWDYDMAILVIPMTFLASDAFRDKWTAGRFILLLSMWVAEPTLRVVSGKIGLQLGPFLWAVLLGYSVFLVTKEQSRTTRKKVPVDRGREIQ